MLSASDSPVFDRPSGVNIFDDAELALLAKMARRGAFEICLQAGHGHIGACSGAAELLVVLYFGGVLRFNPRNPNDHRRDRVIVRGHLGPLRYRLFAWLGWIAEYELGYYRHLGSRLHGHEDHLHTPGVDITPSGSLGMVLSYGVGCAIAMRESKSDAHTWVFLGDGEEQEGVISEAARHAAHLGLGNLIVVIDQNGKQLSNPVRLHDSGDLTKIWDGYGWHAETISDGNDVSQVRQSFEAAVKRATCYKSPCVILAKTVKGLGLSGAKEHYSGYHTITRASPTIVREGIEEIDRVVDQKDAKRTIGKLSPVATGPDLSITAPPWRPVNIRISVTHDTPNNPDACQKDYFQKFRTLDTTNEIKKTGNYFLTADVTTLEAENELSVRDSFSYYNVGLREQHMIAMGHGISVTQPSARILINSLDAFTYRSLDQLHAAAQGRGNLVVLGDVSGLTNSRNGRTHQPTGISMALETLEGLTFLEPWDAEDTFACLNWAIGESRGIVYIRLHSSSVRKTETTRNRTLTYYQVLDGGPKPCLVMVSSGLTVDGCIKAASLLSKEGKSVRVINIVNHRSLDQKFAELLPENAPILAVYNGHPSVLSSIIARSLVENGRSASTLRSIGYTHGETGTLEELLHNYGLEEEGILKEARSLIISPKGEMAHE